ncbi:hypothetical protein MPSEU_000684700 [Mayamaea pseudoterrestris]|nr:hypothetical protein MPSEU_000684700 [Mayamaea pseudoterrestris]
MTTTYDKDPYQVLGVAKDVDDATIKKAYRKLALLHHPDRKSDPNEREAATKLFTDISGAYEILTDPTMRKEWDREVGSGGSVVGGATSGSGGGDGKKKPRGFKFNPSDPYEVWKRDFELQFGRPYPGAVADVVSLDTHIFSKREGVTELKTIDKRGVGGGGNGGDKQIGGKDGSKKKGEILRLENGQAGDGNGDDSAAASADAERDGGNNNDTKKKKKGFFARLFGKKDKKSDLEVPANGKGVEKEATQARPTTTTRQPNAPKAKVMQPPKAPAASKTPSKETAMVLSSKNKKEPSDEKALALRNNETSIVEHDGEPEGHDNRPISMEVTVEEAADGSTVTTTTITRPDGTVEKCVQRTGIPGKDPKKLAQIEGEKKKLAIEADKNKNLAIEGEKKKHLALENGKSKAKQTNGKGQMLLTSA